MMPSIRTVHHRASDGLVQMQKAIHRGESNPRKKSTLSSLRRAIVKLHADDLQYPIQVQSMALPNELSR